MTRAQRSGWNSTGCNSTSTVNGWSVEGKKGKYSQRARQTHSSYHFYFTRDALHVTSRSRCVTRVARKCLRRICNAFSPDRVISRGRRGKKKELWEEMEYIYIRISWGLIKLWKKWKIIAWENRGRCGIESYIFDVAYRFIKNFRKTVGSYYWRY